MGRYHIYLKSGARIVVEAYKILLPDPSNQPTPYETTLRVYTDPPLEEPDGGITILKSEVAAAIVVDDTVQ
jgi:hypothetical protein